MYKAALFDLDGVVFDTEPQYSIFWESQFNLYYPEKTGMSEIIKGQTLDQIFNKYFGEYKSEWNIITKRLDEFELQMSFTYIKGFETFIQSVLASGLKTAIVTSSNKPKMENVYKSHPELKSIFNKILTSEDFNNSKPHPECYIKCAEYFNISPKECIGFEDSFNGLKSVRSAEMFVVGLSTTNSPDAIAPYSDITIPDYTGLTYSDICELSLKK